jgi:hypothetical protein
MAAPPRVNTGYSCCFITASSRYGWRTLAAKALDLGARIAAMEALRHAKAYAAGIYKFLVKTGSSQAVVYRSPKLNRA